LKIHIAVDIKNKKIISLKVNDEHIHDGKVLSKLVEDIKKTKAHDSWQNIGIWSI
jgi:ribosomal protein S17